MSKVLAIILLSIVSQVTAQNEHQITATEEDRMAIDQYLNELISELDIPGISLAIIKDGKPYYKANHGFANLEHRVPLNDQSIFRVYSLSKLVVAVGVFQLIEKGELSLEDKISKYLIDIPTEWKDIQIKHLLTHSSGLPDMSPIPEYQDLDEQKAIAKVKDEAIRFEAGTKYDYNQTGFYILQKIIEKLTESELSKWIKANQFQSPCDTMFFSSDSRDIVLNRTTPYFPFTKGVMTIDHPYLQGNYAHALNGLNISLNEFIRWDQLLRDNKLIKKKTKSMMWELFDYRGSDKKFTYGWDVHNFEGKKSYGFSGSLVTAYRFFPDDNLSIIFLSNGLGQFYNIEHVMNQLGAFILN